MKFPELFFFQVHNAELLRNIESRLPKLMEEYNDTSKTDLIDEKLASDKHEEEYGKECPVCGKEYYKRKLKCKVDGCNNADLIVSKRAAENSADDGPSAKKRRRSTMTRHEFFPSGSTSTMLLKPQGPAMYDHITSNHPEEPIKITARDPVFANPNSFASVIKVLQAIGKDLQINKYSPSSKRKWAVIVCDGLPFSLCTRILKETYTCSRCKEAIFTEAELEKHMKNVHKENKREDVPTPEFDWVLLRIGYGHYEMNMVRFHVQN